MRRRWPRQSIWILPLVAAPGVALAHGPGSLVGVFWLPLLMALIIFAATARARVAAKLMVMGVVAASWFLGVVGAIHVGDLLRLDPLDEEFVVFAGSVVLPVVAWVGVWRFIRARERT